MKRTLRLKRESLAELSGDELVELVGGARPETVTCPLNGCDSRVPSWNPCRDPLYTLVC